MLDLLDCVIKQYNRTYFGAFASTRLCDTHSRGNGDLSILTNWSVLLVDLWEDILFKLNDSRRYRRTVGSIAGSCITAAIPLLASFKQEICLAALDIIEVPFGWNAFTLQHFSHWCKYVKRIFFISMGFFRKFCMIFHKLLDTDASYFE